MMYVQCKLISTTNLIDTRWIPEKLAKVGKYIEVKADKSLWKVEATYGKLSEAQVIEARDLHKHHRKGTDI
jgi:hypothetical protein